MRRLLPFIFFILLVLAVIAAPFFLPLNTYRSRIGAALTERLQHTVLIGKLEVGYFPPALKLKDVGLMSSSGNTVLLQVEQVIAPLHLGSLFKGRLVPRALDLRGWTATLNRKREGTWAWEEWLAPSVRAGGESGWPLSKVTFDRGQVDAVDSYGPGPERFILQILQGTWEGGRQYISMNGVMTSLPAPVNFLFQGSGQFFSTPQWTGVLALTEKERQWKLECKLSGGHLQATGRSEEWRFDTAYSFLRYYARLPVAPPTPSESTVLRGWTSQFDRQASTLTFTQSAQAGESRTEAAGMIFYDAGLPKLHVDLAFQGLPLQPVETVLWGNAPLEGTATGAVRLTVAMSSGSWNAMNGQGALEIQNGRYLLPNSSMQKLSKARTLRYLLKKYPGFLQGGMPFKNASVHWKIRQGVSTFEDAFCNLGDIRVALAGFYDAERRGLDAYMRVLIQEQNPKLLKELPATYVYKGGLKAQIQPMHGRVLGTPAEWNVRATRGSKVPAATLIKLSHTLRSK